MHKTVTAAVRQLSPPPAQRLKVAAGRGEQKLIWSFSTTVEVEGKEEEEEEGSAAGGLRGPECVCSPNLLFVLAKGGGGGGEGGSAECSCTTLFHTTWEQQQQQQKGKRSGAEGNSRANLREQTLGGETTLDYNVVFLSLTYLAVHYGGEMSENLLGFIERRYVTLFGKCQKQRYFRFKFQY